MRRSPLAFLTAIVAGALVLGACGTASDESSGPRVVFLDKQQALFAAATTTLDSGSSRMALEISMDAGGSFDELGLGDLAFGAEGMFEFDTGDGLMTMDMGSLADAIGEPDLDLDIEMRIVDQVVYMNMGSLSEMMGVDTEWMSLDANAALSELGVTDQTFSQLQQQANATSYVELLSAASDDVQEMGRDEVRGVQTTRYLATLDLQRMMDAGLEQLSDDLRARLEEEMASGSPFAELGDMFNGVTIPTQVWVDDDGRLRKMTMTFSFAEMAGALGDAGVGMPADLSMSMTVELWDYGVEVDVEAPPAGEVTDLMSILQGMGALDAAA